MTQQPPPPGGWPPQSDSPTQPNYPTPAGGYPPPPPTGDGYPTPPPPPPPAGGYPPPPPPSMPYYVAPQPRPPENHTTRNVVIGAIVALIAVLLIGGFYAATRPSPSFPVIIPTAKPSSAPTTTPEATATPEEITPKPTRQQPTDEPAATPTEVAAVTPAPTEPAPSEPAQTEPAPTEVVATNPATSPGSSLIPGTEDQGIVLGDPVVIGEESLEQAALLLQNNTNLVKSYSVKATYKNGDTITATATGFVSDHLPGTIRTATLYFSGEAPAADDVVSVQIDTMLTEDASTPNGDIAKQVTFGPPTINIDEFFSSIDVEVTNGSDIAASIGVTAAILRDGVLVGTGTGFASDAAAGQTKTVSLFVTGELEETDDLLLSVDTVVPTE